jgi:hypothetical protein
MESFGAFIGAVVVGGFILGLVVPRHRYLAASLGVPIWLVLGWYWWQLPSEDDTNPTLPIFLIWVGALFLLPYWVGMCLSAPVRPQRPGDFRRRRGRERIGDL